MSEAEKPQSAQFMAARLNALIEREAAKLPNKGYQEFAGQPQKASNVFFTTSVLGMSSISHVIEDQALTMGQSIRLFASFQKFSRLKIQEQRYRQLLAARIPVYLFGQPDAPLWVDPFLHPIAMTMPRDAAEPSLTNNWFVVLDNPQFVSMALLSRELPQSEHLANAPDKLIYRNFEGFWTYDKEVIGDIVRILDNYIGNIDKEI